MTTFPLVSKEEGWSRIGLVVLHILHVEAILSAHLFGGRPVGNISLTQRLCSFLQSFCSLFGSKNCGLGDTPRPEH